MRRIIRRIMGFLHFVFFNWQLRRKSFWNDWKKVKVKRKYWNELVVILAQEWNDVQISFRILIILWSNVISTAIYHFFVKFKFLLIFFLIFFVVCFYSTCYSILKNIWDCMDAVCFFVCCSIVFVATIGLYLSIVNACVAFFFHLFDWEKSWKWV